jgi:hypothetical protein
MDDVERSGVGRDTARGGVCPARQTLVPSYGAGKREAIYLYSLMSVQSVSVR